jgi:hypothetical protein
MLRDGPADELLGLRHGIVQMASHARDPWRSAAEKVQPVPCV